MAHVKSIEIQSCAPWKRALLIKLDKCRMLLQYEFNTFFKLVPDDPKYCYFRQCSFGEYMRIHISIRKTLNSSNITLHFLWSSALYPPTQAFLGELVLWEGMKNELPEKRLRGRLSALPFVILFYVALYMLTWLLRRRDS